MLKGSVSSIPSIWASMNSWFSPAILFLLLNVMIATIAFISTLANTKKLHQNQQQNPPNHPQNLVRSSSVLQRLRSINFSTYAFYQTHAKQTPDSDAQQTKFFETHSEFFFSQINQENCDSSSFDHVSRERNTRCSSELAPQEMTPNNDVHSIFQETRGYKVAEFETHFDSHRLNEEGAEENPAHEENFENDELQSLDEVYSKLSHVSRSKSDTNPDAGEVPEKLPEKMSKSASLKSAFHHFGEEEIVEAQSPATVKEKSRADVDDEVNAKADDFITKFRQQLKLQRLESIIRYKEMIGRGGSGR